MNNTTTITQVPHTTVNWYYSARFWLSFGLIGTLTNTLEVFLICHRKKYKSIFGMTLLSLSISDVVSSLCFFVVGLLRIIEYDGTATLKIIAGTKLAMVWQGGHGALFFSMGTSFIHIVIIAVQRSFAVFMPLKYGSSFRVKHCAILLLTVWLLFFVGGILGYFYLQAIWYASYILTLVICLTLILCYTAIVVKNFRAEQNRRRLMSGKLNDVNKNVRKTSSKVLRLSMAVTVAFLLCTLPHSIFYLFVRKNWTYYHTINSMISVNPLLDSIVYFVFYHQRDKTRSATGYISKPTASKVQTFTERGRDSPASTPMNDSKIFTKNSKKLPRLNMGIALKAF